MFRLLAVLITVLAVRLSIPDVPEQDWYPSREGTELLKLINRHRQQVGCEPMVLDRRLDQCSGQHSWDMRHWEFFDHNSRNGDTPFDRIRGKGVRYLCAGENIAEAATAREVFTLWMRSPRHRAILENCRFRVCGIGDEADLHHHYWTLDCVQLRRGDIVVPPMSYLPPD